MEAWRRQVGRAAYVAGTVAVEINEVAGRIEKIPAFFRIAGERRSHDAMLRTDNLFMPGGEMEKAATKIHTVVQNAIQTEATIRGAIKAQGSQVISSGVYAPAIQKLKIACLRCLRAIHMAIYDAIHSANDSLKLIVNNEEDHILDMNRYNIDALINNGADSWVAKNLASAEMRCRMFIDMVIGMENTIKIVKSVRDHPFLVLREEADSDDDEDVKRNSKNNKQWRINDTASLTVISTSIDNTKKLGNTAIEHIQDQAIEIDLPLVFQTLCQYTIHEMNLFVSYRKRENIKRALDILQRVTELLNNEYFHETEDASKPYNTHFHNTVQSYLQSHTHPFDENFDVDAYLRSFDAIDFIDGNMYGKIANANGDGPPVVQMLDFRGALLRPSTIALLMDFIWIFMREEVVNEMHLNNMTAPGPDVWFSSFFYPDNYNNILAYFPHGSDRSTLTLCRRIAVLCGARIVSSVDDINTEREIAAVTAIMQPYTDEMATVYFKAQTNWPARYHQPVDLYTYSSDEEDGEFVDAMEEE